jgi:uncharacterized membrane protein
MVPVASLVLIVLSVLALAHQPASARLFRWLPIPLWCYALPMVASSLGWLPRGHPAFQAVMDAVLPFALALLLLGVELRSVLRIGWRALGITAIGSASIVAGAPLVAWLLRAGLPDDAWKGVGTLAATWTGGSMNLLALKTIVGTPEEVFTSLIIVDALVAYSWMALLVGLASVQASLDRWLRATPLELSSIARPSRQAWTAQEGIVCLLLALLLTAGSQSVAALMPTNALISSRRGWVVLLVTTLALGGSLVRPIRARSRSAPSLGYPCLYLVLAAMGAQASFSSLRAAPIWIAVGAGIALLHGITMLVAGRLLRLPLGMLATASQANLGGVASTPIVGAVYDQRLAPVGLLLAIGLNAIGTYLGLLSAALSRL